MKKKNGFVFIETMIVVVILIVSLLVLYSSYVGFMTIERKYARYDDPAYIYKTKTLADFLNNIKDPLGNSKLRNKIISSKEDEKYIVVSQWDNSGLFDIESEKDFFVNLLHELRINNVIIISKKQINQLSSTDGNVFGEDFYRYLKQIDTKDDSDNTYYLVTDFSEKNNGQQCTPNEIANQMNSTSSSEDSGKPTSTKETSCIRYYASIKINLS